MSDIKNSSLATDLVSYWELEEASGTRVDSHGSNDLTDNNTVGQGTGIIGDGADFERTNTDEYLSYNDTGGVFNPSGDFSISLWYKLESTGNACLVDYGNDASSGWLIQDEASNRIFVRRDTTTGNKDVTYTHTQDTSWHHLVVVSDQGSTLKIYYDGTERSSIANGGTGDGTTGEFKIGALLNGASYVNEMDGVIDEVGFWSRALSASDVTALYNSGAGLPYEAAAPTNTYSLTVNASKVAATLTDYPAYVDLADMPASFWAGVTSGGGDIRVYSDSGLTTELAREVVSCDTTGETGEMHVKVSSLTTSSVIYLTIDGTSADYAVTDTYGRDAVWSDYISVYHFEGSAGTAGKVENATGDTSLNATENASPTSTTGKLGSTDGGYDFTGSTVGVTVADDAAMEVADVTTQSWLKTTDTAYSALWARYDSASARVFRVLTINNDLWSVYYLSDNSNTGIPKSAGTINNGAWRMIHAVSNVASGDVRQYIDGSVDGTATSTTGVLQQGHNVTLKIGLGNAQETNGVDGQFDEFRMRSGQLSANWITTEYNNQSDVATFWTIAEEGGGGATNNAMFFGGGI